MLSKEENKLKEDVQDTASSDFYTPSQFVPLRELNQVKQVGTIQQLEDHIAKIKQILASGKELFKRLQSNEQLKRYIEQTQQELNVVKGRSANQLSNLKLSFQKNYSSLERQLAAHRKNWKISKQSAQAQIEEQIHNFKQTNQKDQAHLNKAFNSVGGQLKNKINTLGQELKQYKRSRKESNQNLIGLIQQARIKFDAGIEKERKKRNQYDSIVLGLLDRTVEQGERLMRRIG